MSRPPLSSEPGYQEEGSNVRIIFYWICGLFALGFISFFLSVGFHWALLRWTPFATNTTPVSPLAQYRRVPPEPRLQANPTTDMAHWRETENMILTSSPTWVDAQAGVVRIPLARAMELVASEGLPARKGETR